MLFPELRELRANRLGWDAFVPEPRETFSLD